MNADFDSDDTMTSSECSDGDQNDSETESCKSLAFSVKSDCSTAVVRKTNKSKKSVRFKPGDSLLLIYEIPNREMLGLKSESEDSDDSDSDDSDDEDDDDDDDDDDDEDDDQEENNDNQKRNNNIPKKDNNNNIRNSKPFGKLISVRQVTKKKLPIENKMFQKQSQDPSSKLIRLSLSAPPTRSRKRYKVVNKPKERKERIKTHKKEFPAINIEQDNKTKQNKPKKNKFKSIKPDIDKVGKLKRKKPNILEIKATVDSNSSVPKVLYKHDLKPSIIDVNGSLSVCGSKQLVNRTRLQPTSFRLAPTRDTMTSRPHSNTSLPERQTSVHQVVSTSYDAFSNRVEESFFRLNSPRNAQRCSSSDILKRVDPDNMNDEGKRHYAWQVANGAITSQSLRTPSILPFWDSLRSSISESKTVTLSPENLV